MLSNRRRTVCWRWRDSEFRIQKQGRDGIEGLQRGADGFLYTPSMSYMEDHMSEMSTDPQVRTQGSVNGINVRTGVGVSKEKRDAETRVGRPPLLLAGNAPDRLHSN